MNRTAVLLPSALKSRVIREAADKNLSFDELVCMALETYLMKKKTLMGVQDTFFDDNVFYKGKVSADIAKNHDDYLYGN